MVAWSVAAMSVAVQPAREQLSFSRWLRSAVRLERPRRPMRWAVAPLRTLLAACALLSTAGVALAASEGPEPELARAVIEPNEKVFNPFLAELEERTFRFFWETGNPRNGLVPDRYPTTPSVASIAAVGFALTAYPIGVERGYISRSEARDRVLATLRFFARAPNQNGFFYHFVDMSTGKRANGSEVSTVDTSLLLAGMLFCQEYFDSSDPQEIKLRKWVDDI